MFEVPAACEQIATPTGTILVSCLLSLVSCLLSLVSCLLSLVSCLLSVVRCPLSVVRCPLSVVLVSEKDVQFLDLGVDSLTGQLFSYCVRRTVERLGPELWRLALFRLDG